MSEISKQALKVDNNTSFPNNNTGYISPSILRAFNVNMIDSLVEQAGYDVDSGSWNVSIGQLEAYTASFAPSLTQLNAFTASQIVINTNLNQFTQSANASISKLDTFSSSFNAYTASINQIQSNGVVLGTSTRFNFVGSGTFFSASITPNVGGPIATLNLFADNSKVNTSSFNDYTASEAAAFASYSSSVSSSITALSSSTAVSIAALNAYTQSDDVSIDLLNAFTASQNILNTTFATTGSNNFVGVQTITGSVSISGSAATDLEIQGRTLIVGPTTGQTPQLIVSASDANTTVGRGTFTIVGTGTGNFQASQQFGGYMVAYSDDGSELSITADNNQYAARWNGPAIGGNDPLDTYPVFFGFQNKSTWTDGTVTALTPMILSSSLNVVLSSNFQNNVRITGSLIVSSSAVNDVEIIGRGLISGPTPQLIISASDANGVFSRNTLTYVGSGTGNYQASSNFGGYSVVYLDDGTELAMNADASQYSSGWTKGPSISINDNSDNYPAVIGFQNKTNYTDGRVTILTPLEVTKGAIVTGSVYGNIISQSISSNTASLNLTGSNFFTIDLVSGSTTRIEVSNIRAGQTINVLISQPSVGTGSVTYPSTIKFPAGNNYIPTTISGSKDIITFVAFDNSTIYATAVNNLV